jgi:hypothetical protein
MIFAIMPIFALGGIGVPALQSLATRQVDESQQGQFQGVLASAVSLASIIAPLGLLKFLFCRQAAMAGRHLAIGRHRLCDCSATCAGLAIEATGGDGAVRP